MTRILMSCIALLCFSGIALGGVTQTLTVGNTSGFPGDTVTALVMLDTDAPAQGFQLGIQHDGSIASSTLIEQGAELLATNGGAGVDFFNEDIAPAGGAGVTFGCIISLAPPLESLGPGTGLHVATVTYTIAPTALPGTFSPLQITGALGTPPLAVVVSVGGVSIAPAMNHGQIDVTTPAVSDLAATTLDVCLCSAELTWTNGFAYDSIEVTENGAVIATLAGTATSHALTLGAAASYGVRGIANGAASADTLTTASCSIPAVGNAPTDALCTINHDTCEVTLEWTNNETDYAAIEILVDGVLEQTLAGTETSAIVTLAGTEILTTLDVRAIDACGIALATTGCTAECLPERFVRGDANGDGSIDISDAIGILDHVFLGAATNCRDAVDPNDDGNPDISDAIFLLTYVFSNGVDPLAPFPACGVDPTDTDSLDCAVYTCP